MGVPKNITIAYLATACLLRGQLRQVDGSYRRCRWGRKNVRLLYSISPTATSEAPQAVVQDFPNEKQSLPFRRCCTRITVVACHGPPPGVGISRLLSSRAIALRSCLPEGSAAVIPHAALPHRDFGCPWHSSRPVSPPSPWPPARRLWCGRRASPALFRPKRQKGATCRHRPQCHPYCDRRFRRRAA